MLIGMPVYDDVEMIDVTAPTTCSRWAGLDVELVTEKPGLVRFRNGFCFELTKSLKQARRWDAIWVPGGDVTALKRLMGDKVFLEFLKRQSARATYVASVVRGHNAAGRRQAARRLYRDHPLGVHSVLPAALHPA